jgi:hypothetical protein
MAFVGGEIGLCHLSNQIMSKSSKDAVTPKFRPFTTEFISSFYSSEPYHDWDEALPQIESVLITCMESSNDSKLKAIYTILKITDLEMEMPLDEIKKKLRSKKMKDIGLTVSPAQFCSALYRWSGVTKESKSEIPYTNNPRILKFLEALMKGYAATLAKDS